MNNNEIIWRTIPSFPNYEASNTGLIRRKLTSIVLRQQESETRGYQNISLFTKGKKYTKKVARLIWETFNDCPCQYTIDHIDGNPTNNNLTNLRCVPLKDNLKNRNIYVKKNKYNLTEDKKIQIISDYRSGKKTTWDLMKETGIPLNYLQTVFKRRSWDKLLWKAQNTNNTSN